MKNLLLSLFILLAIFFTKDSNALPTEKKININVFAFNLYDQIKKENGNVFFSPYSLASTLLLTYEGASGNTKIQIQNLFGINEIQKIILDAHDLKLNLSNALWLEKEYSFLPGFLNTAKNNFSAHLSRVDFKKKYQEATVQINQWVEKATAGRIKNLISPGAVDSLTRMVLTNAIYFKEEWQHAFDTSRTYNAPFYLDDNTQIYVPMMFRQESFRYYSEESFQMIELPYSQSDLSMMVLLPAKDSDFSTFESSLNACFFKENIKNLKKQKIQLSLPKFGFSTPYTMSGILKKMGMTDAFTRRADFSRIDGTRNLYISEIFHKAFIQVNEKGTQASAGSGAVMGLGGISSNPLFIADHPFIFFIFDRSSNTILFMGRVTNPT